MLRVAHDRDVHEDAVHEHAPVEGGGLVEGAAMDIDELCRVAAREMIAVALEAERRAYLDAHAEVRDATGKRVVVGNGYAPRTPGHHGRGPGRGARSAGG
jgi:hypothetical protein